MSCSEVSGYGWAYLLSLTFVTSNQGEDRALTSYSIIERKIKIHISFRILTVVQLNYHRLTHWVNQIKSFESIEYKHCQCSFDTRAS